MGSRPILLKNCGLCWETCVRKFFFREIRPEEQRFKRANPHRISEQILRVSTLSSPKFPRKIFFSRHLANFLRHELVNTIEEAFPSFDVAVPKEALLLVACKFRRRRSWNPPNARVVRLITTAALSHLWRNTILNNVTRSNARTR